MHNIFYVHEYYNEVDYNISEPPRMMSGWKIVCIKDEAEKIIIKNREDRLSLMS